MGIELTEIQLQILMEAITMAKTYDIHTVKRLRENLLKNYYATDVDAALKFWANWEVRNANRGK